MKFLITPAQEAALAERKPGENLNTYARNRLLQRRLDNSVAKQHLNEVGVDLRTLLEKMHGAAFSLAATHPNDPDVNAMIEGVHDLQDVFTRLLEMNKIL